MEVTRIDLAGGKPTGVQVNMSIVEAMYLARLTGTQNGDSNNKVFPGGDVPGSAVYGALIAEVFNLFWEDGVDEAVREMR